MSLDLSLPLLLGTAWFSNADPAAADASISAYLEAGGRVLDTARIYGESEDVVGAWLRAHGEAAGVQVLTKGAHPDPADWHPRLAREEVLADARTSVGKLGRPADAYLLHRDDPATPVEEVADTLRAVVDEGLAAAVGVSNWRFERIRGVRSALGDRGLPLVAVSDYVGLALPSGPPDWDLQVGLDRATLGWLETEGIPNLAWSSQSGGYFAGVFRGHQFDGAENARRRTALERVATAAGVRPEAVLARWSATMSAAVVPVLASRSPERLRRIIADSRDAALDPVVAELIAAVDPSGSLGPALTDPAAAVW